MAGEKGKAREVPLIDVTSRYCVLTLDGDREEEAREFLRSNRSRLPELAEHYAKLRDMGVMGGIKRYEERLERRERLLREVMAEEEGTEGSR